MRGRTKEALATNAQLTSISTDLQMIFQRLEFSEELSLERIKSEYLGKREDMETVLSLFTKYNNDVYAQIGCGVTKANYRKFDICKRHFARFLQEKYARTDLNTIEFTPIVIHDFDVYLKTVVGQSFNTAIKTLKTFKTVIIFGRKAGVFNHDPFLNIHFKSKRVDRGFLTDEELDAIMHKEFATQRLVNVRDIFLFSCFTGLAYVDVTNLTPDNIITMDGKQWIVTARQKTDTLSHILLLNIPKMIIKKYDGKEWQIDTHSQQPAHEFLFERDSRCLQYQQEPDLSHRSTYLCHDDAHKRSPSGVCFQNVRIHKHNYNSALCPHNKQEDRERYACCIQEIG